MPVANLDTDALAPPRATRLPAAARLTLVTLLFLASVGAAPMDRPDVDVKKAGSEFLVIAAHRIPASQDAVWAALTDYDRWPSFIEPMTRSRSIEVNDDASRLVEQVTLVRFLFVRRESRATLLIKEFPKTHIVSALVDGDFITYHVDWRLEAVGPEACVLKVQMKVRPKMTGPSFVEKRLLATGMKKTLTGLRDEAVRRMRGWQEK